MSEPLPKRPTAFAFRWLRRLALAGFLALGLLLFAWWTLPHWMPLPPGLQAEPAAALLITDRQDRPLRLTPTGASGAITRPLTFAQLPPAFVDAIIAAEDQRFFHHPGVDPLAIARAVRDRLAGQVSGGASGITQQLIKLTSPERPRDWPNKLVQTLQALALERQWSKESIVTAYANRTAYGRLNRGLAAAADFYFAKPLGDLTPAECALLAALPHAPGRLDPLRNAEAARERQQWILERMHRLGKLDDAAFQRAKREPLQFAHAGRAFHAPHFVDRLLQEEQPNDGEVWRTTLDLPLQQAIERIVTAQVERWEQDGLEHAAVVVIENATGDLLAMVGSADYRAIDGMVNGATAVRSPGSALKPFLYLAAFERDWSPATLLPDIPQRFPSPTGVYEPVNYDREFRGPIRCRLALANSLNVPAISLLRDLGGPAILQDQLKAFGITTLEEEPEHYGLGLAIGGGGVTLLELTNAYAALARLGEWRSVRTSLEAPIDPTRQLAERRPAWLIADILADPQARVQAFGRQNPFRLPFRVAVKTGTSTDFRDNWAFGYTPEVTVGVWTGNFAGTPMRGLAGVVGAGPILGQVFRELARDRELEWYAQPDGIAESWIDPVTGVRLAERGESLSGSAVREVYLEEKPPPSAPERGPVVLPAVYAEWLQDAGRSWQRFFATERTAAQPFRILFPTNGTRIVMDPDLPNGGRLLAPKADHPVKWSSPSLEIVEVGGRPFFRIEPGRHTLLAEGLEGGRQAVEIRVRRRGE